MMIYFKDRFYWPWTPMWNHYLSVVCTSMKTPLSLNRYGLEQVVIPVPIPITIIIATKNYPWLSSRLKLVLNYVIRLMQAVPMDCGLNFAGITLQVPPIIFRRIYLESVWHWELFLSSTVFRTRLSGILTLTTLFHLFRVGETQIATFFLRILSK